MPDIPAGKQIEKVETKFLALPTDSLPSLIPNEAEHKAIQAQDMPFLPTIKLLQGTSPEIGDEIPDPSGKKDDYPPHMIHPHKAGDFFISSEDLNLSNKLRIVVVARRSHALLLRGKERIKESFNFESPVFQEIATTPDDRTIEVVAFSGVGDWLLYLPEHDRFVTYFCGRRSSRPCADDIIDHITPMDGRTTKLAKERPFTDHFELYSHFETKMFGSKYRCYIPKVTPLKSFESKDISKELTKQAKLIFFTPVMVETQMIKVDSDAEVVDR